MKSPESTEKLCEKIKEVIQNHENESLVEMFRYQTPNGRPWVQFWIEGYKFPIWYYWVFETNSSYELPKDWKPPTGSPTGYISNQGWEGFEGDNPEVNLRPLTRNVMDNFPDTSVIEEQVHKMHYRMKIHQSKAEPKPLVLNDP